MDQDSISRDVGRRTANTGLALLMLAAVFSFLDRQILTLLVQPIKHDIGLTDTQIGILQGFAFAVLFAFAALPIGWLVDRVHRWRVAAVGIALWSIATIGCGFAHSFGELLAARVLIGIGEASLMPAAYSLLADLFPIERRGRVFGIYSLAIFAGGGGSLLLGGFILHALGTGQVNLGPLGVRPVWQATFLLVGAPGLPLALALALRRDPRRQRSAPVQGRAADAEPIGLLDYVRRHPVPFALVWGAYVLNAFAAFAVIPWMPVSLARRFALLPAQVGFAAGFTQLIGGVTGSLVSGILADRWTRANLVGAKFRLTVVMWIGVLPSLVLLAFAQRMPLVLGGMLLFSFFNTVGYVSAAAVIQDMVPAHLRGRATGFWYLVTGILGNGAGPFATALVTDRVLGNEAALGPAMLIAAGPAMLLGLLVSLAGLRPHDRLRHALANNEAAHE